ncbi:alpha/beta fold hydrolase [Pseudomonas cichorii]|uniref:alpha/beta fold hydrolase n=1 Tax=Pseudomonas cichorii TaxID=36746 RepID=UPI001C8AD525|nr:alpha/beta hydrolase [Pseudomonas cichorii]MBX8496312.1 alpha/beta hydrolase [Pseudomonas cichorii]
MSEAARNVVQPTVIGERIEIRPGRFINIARHIGAPEEKRVLFFCHGSGGNKDQWREQWQVLAAQGFHLVAWDMLGHGVSDKPKQAEAYAWNELVDDYLEVLRRYQGEHTVLIAHSFGTGLTLSALAKLQQTNSTANIESVLLLGSLLSRPQGRNPILSLPAWLLERLRPWLAKGFKDRAWHPTADPALIAYEQQLTERNPLYVFKSLMTQASWPTLSELDSITIRTHVMAGETDGLTPAASGEALAQRLPNASFELLEACGHQLMLEKPQAVLLALGRLLEGAVCPVG